MMSGNMNPIKPDHRDFIPTSRGGEKFNDLDLKTREVAFGCIPNASEARLPDLNASEILQKDPERLTNESSEPSFNLDISQASRQRQQEEQMRAGWEGLKGFSDGASLDVTGFNNALIQFSYIVPEIKRHLLKKGHDFPTSVQVLKVLKELLKICEDEPKIRELLLSSVTCKELEDLCKAVSVILEKISFGSFRFGTILGSLSRLKVDRASLDASLEFHRDKQVEAKWMTNRQKAIRESIFIYETDPFAPGYTDLSLNYISQNDKIAFTKRREDPCLCSTEIATIIRWNRSPLFLDALRLASSKGEFRKISRDFSGRLAIHLKGLGWNVKEESLTAHLVLEKETDFFKSTLKETHKLTVTKRDVEGQLSSVRGPSVSYLIQLDVTCSCQVQEESFGPIVTDLKLERKETLAEEKSIVWGSMKTPSLIGSINQATFGQREFLIAYNQAYEAVIREYEAEL